MNHRFSTLGCAATSRHVARLAVRGAFIALLHLAPGTAVIQHGYAHILDRPLVLAVESDTDTGARIPPLACDGGNILFEIQRGVPALIDGVTYVPADTVLSSLREIMPARQYFHRARLPVGERPALAC